MYPMQQRHHWVKASEVLTASLPQVVVACVWDAQAAHQHWWLSASNPSRSVSAQQAPRDAARAEAQSQLFGRGDDPAQHYTTHAHPARGRLLRKWHCNCLPDAQFAQTCPPP
eukprot:362989-Chlamydomonas_euryale.AAC.1